MRHALGLLLSHLLTLSDNPNAALWILQTRRKMAAVDARIGRLSVSLTYGVFS